MTIPSDSFREVYTGTDSLAQYDYTWRIYNKNQLSVTKVLVADETDETPLVVDVDYTVTGVNNAGGGSIILTAGNLPNTEKIVILPNFPFQQDVDLTNQSSVPPERAEEMGDKLSGQIKQLKEKVDRAVTIPVGSSDTPENYLAQMQDILQDTEQARDDAVDAKTDAEAVLTDAGFIAVAADLTGSDTIGVVAGIQANVTSVAGNATNINTCATNIAAIIAAPTQASNAAASAATALAAQVAAQAAASAVANQWNFDTSTTMADPGSTDIRFNNATLASVTQIAISATSNDTGNPDVSDYIVTWDDSNHTPRGILNIRTADGDIAQFGITGSVTDNGAWLQIPVAYIAGSATLASGEDVYISFAGYGNDGTGNVNNNGTPTAGQLGIWVSATAIKGVTASGDVVIDSNGVVGLTNASITGKTTAAPATGDSAIFSDVSDSNNLKKTTFNDILALTTMAMLKSGQLASGVGAIATSGSLGTVSSGTVTPLATTNGNFNHYTNNGAHTLAPPAGVCTMVIEVLNGASAGAITTSSFTKVDVSEYNTTNGNKFHFYITKGNAYSSLIVKALQ